MFSLIITIISIVLVAALALATIYYGSDAFNNGSAKAKITQKLTEAQQIKGAATVYLAQNPGITSFTLNDLISQHYLADAPASWTAVQANVAGSDVQTIDMCNAINKTLGNAYATAPSPPACSSLSAGTEACCAN